MDIGWFAWVVLALVIAVVLMVAAGWLSWLVTLVEHTVRRSRRYFVRYHK